MYDKPEAWYRRWTPDWVKINIFGVTPRPPHATRAALLHEIGWQHATPAQREGKFASLMESFAGETQVMTWAFDKLTGMQTPLGVILGFELSILAQAPRTMGVWVAFLTTVLAFVYVQWALSARLKVYGKVPDIGLTALKIEGDLESRALNMREWVWHRSHIRTSIERKYATANFLMMASVIMSPLALTPAFDVMINTVRSLWS